MNLNADGIEKLREGIVKQAITDYASLLLGYTDSTYDIYELNEFFNNEGFFSELVNIDKNIVLKGVRLRELKQIIDTYSLALGDENIVSFQIHINTPTRKRKNIHFKIPPVLNQAWVDTLAAQLQELNKEYEAAQTKPANDVDMVESYLEHTVKHSER